MKKSKATLRSLVLAAFIAGVIAPIAAQASFSDYLRCLRTCQGSCNFYGHCFVIEN